MITLTGLSKKQHALCDIMWAIGTHDGVENFIGTLPDADQIECRSLIELMIMAFADEVEDTTEAKELLAQFRI
jgi:hypothetical protein